MGAGTKRAVFRRGNFRTHGSISSKNASIVILHKKGGTGYPAPPLDFKWWAVRDSNPGPID